MAEQFNRQMSLSLWTTNCLPEDFALLHPGSSEFAALVRKRQRRYGVRVDGKLGEETLAAMQRIEGIRGTCPSARDHNWPLARMAVPCVAKVSRRQEPKREKTISCLIVHTTGSGIYRRAKRLNCSAYEAAISYYTGPKAYTSHFLAGREEGEFCQLVGLDEIAFHAGIGSVGRRLYSSGPNWMGVNYPLSGGQKRLTERETELYYGWWKERWGSETLNPLQLTHGDPNGVSVGFDFLAHPYRGTYTPWQYRCLAALCVMLEEEFGPLPLYTHSDTHPLQRCNKRGGWDPGPQFQLEKLAEARKNL